MRVASVLNRTGSAMNLRLLTCCLLGLVMVAGCGGETESVTGTVTLDGEALPDAEVEFTPKGGGRPASTTTGPDGKFTLRYSRDEEGAPEGEYIVSITTASTKTGPDGRDMVIPEKVPPKYNVESELVVTVKSGKNDFPFELESGPMTHKRPRRDPDTCE